MAKKKAKKKKKGPHKVKNKVLAIVRKPMYSMKVVKAKKGKGSYNRKSKED